MILSLVEQTIKYAKFFNSRLTQNDLHFWLISPQQHTLAQIKKFIIRHPSIQKKLISPNNKTRQKKLIQTNKKLKTAHKYARLVKTIPTIKLVALTGSLSVNNPKKYDDIDLMIIVSPNTIWLTRPLVVFLTSIFARRRKAISPASDPQGLSRSGSRSFNNKICLNLWLDQLALTVPKKKQNLYTAHEVLQIKPLFDRGGMYHQFILANSWTKNHLATAYNMILAKDIAKEGSELSAVRREQSDQRIVPNLKRSAVYVASLLNLLFFRLQYLYMKKKITREYITPHSAYFHPHTPYPQIKKHLKQTA